MVRVKIKGTTSGLYNAYTVVTTSYGMSGLGILLGKLYNSWAVINPGGMCLSGTVLAATYLIILQVKYKVMVPYRILNVHIVWILLKTLCSPILDQVSFAYNCAAFTMLSNEFSVDKMNNNRDSDGFFSRRLVCIGLADSFYNSTGLSQIIANCQKRFLPFFMCIQTRSADLACCTHVVLLHITWYYFTDSAMHQVVCTNNSASYLGRVQGVGVHSASHLYYSYARSHRL